MEPRSVFHEPCPLHQTNIPLTRPATAPSTVRPIIDYTYDSNRAPPYQLLSKCPSINLTDDDGRIYWLVEDVKFHAPFCKAIMTSNDVKQGDIMMWVRPKKATTEEGRAYQRHTPFTAPFADPDTPYTFYHESNVAGKRKLRGFIVISGSDAPMSRSARKTSYVVLRNLHFVD